MKRSTQFSNNQACVSVDYTEADILADNYHLGQRLISDFDQTDYLGQREGGVLTVGGG